MVRDTCADDSCFVVTDTLILVTVPRPPRTPRQPTPRRVPRRTPVSEETFHTGRDPHASRPVALFLFMAWR